MTTYTIRRPGCTAWQERIPSLEEAHEELEHANRIAPGHIIVSDDDSTDIPCAEDSTHGS